MQAQLCHNAIMTPHHTVTPYSKSSPANRRAGIGMIALGVCLRPALARADMLSGSLLGSVVRGEPFVEPRLVDLLVIGLIIFLVLRLVLRRSNKAESGPDQQPASWDNGKPPEEEEPVQRPAPLQGPADKPNMYSNAQAMWATLKTPESRSGQTASAHLPGSAPTGPPTGATSEEEFLAGAKMAYSRINASLAGGDFDDLEHFVSPDLLRTLQTERRVPASSRPDILLVEATLAGQREQAGRTLMDVDFNVLVREPEAPHNTDRHERWRFSRENTTPGANWLLESMERR